MYIGMPIYVAASVVTHRLLVQQFLTSGPEDAARLQGLRQAP